MSCVKINICNICHGIRKLNTECQLKICAVILEVPLEKSFLCDLYS